MQWWVWLLVGLGAAVVLDRLLLVAEARGWIYWRKRSASTTSVANAFQNVQSLFEPAVEHVVDERADAELDEAEDDDPKEPKAGR